MDHFKEFKEAIEFHEWARVAGWNPHPFPLFEDGTGPEVVHLTIERFLALTFDGNKVFSGQKIESEKEAKEQIQAFLFFVSPDFDFSQSKKKIEKARKRWNRKNRKIDIQKAFDRIQEFLKFQQVESLSFKWRPSGFVDNSKKEEKPIWECLEHHHFIPVFILFFWANYGMQKTQVMKEPLPVLYQLFRTATPENKSSEDYADSARWIRDQQRKKDQNG